MKASDIIDLMNQWACPHLIDEWDNTGFQLGDLEKEINKIIVALDLDREVLEETLKEEAQMIITHHPLIFKPIKALRKQNYKEKLIMDLIKEDIVVYNAHTNLDLAINGVNDALANILNLKNCQVLKVTHEEPLYKFAVFVPKSHASRIRQVLGNEGAGFIGNYSHCTYNVEGIGTFMPLEGTSPYIGEMNKLEEVEEIRIETIVKKKDLKRVVKEVLDNHPYEEVAYDIYPLENKGQVFGYGRIGEVEKVKLKDYLDFIKRQLKVDNLIVYGDLEKEISKVAVCGGSGATFIHDAYIKGADVYITGDIKYHDSQYASELGITVVDVGHFDTEKVILPVIKEYIEYKTKKSVSVKLYEKSSPKRVVY